MQRGYTCTAALGHPGDHAAYGGNPNTPVHTWPQDTPLPLAPYEPDYDNRCEAQQPGGGYICTCRAGHAGNHVGWWRPDGRIDGSDWPQDPTITQPEEAPTMTMTDTQVLQLLDEELKSEAEGRDWCSEYESFVTRFNHRVGRNVLTPRAKRYEGSVTITFQFTEERNGDARASMSAIREAIEAHVGGYDIEDVEVSSNYDEMEN
jgi:hypothetical protein